jgi:hypothetical protein
MICQKRHKCPNQQKYLTDLLDYGYGHVLALDGIPVSTLSNATHARIPGFQIGDFQKDYHYLYAHVGFGAKLTAVSQDVYEDKYRAHALGDLTRSLTIPW